MYKHTYIEISSHIVWLSIISIVLQFTSYYFVASAVLLYGICSIVSLLSSHLLVEQSQNYHSCFLYSIMTVFISILIYCLTYFGQNKDFIHYSELILGVVLINWLMPTLYCMIRQMLSLGAPIQDFITYFRNNSFLFLFFYILLFTYGHFATSAFPWAYENLGDGVNLTPFWSIASQIEAKLNGTVELNQILTYLFSRILIFIPYGYFITLVLRKQPRLLRFLMLFLLPVAVEILQYFTIMFRCDIDDSIYGFIGSSLGALLFYLHNHMFRIFSGKELLPSSYDYRFSRKGLHF